MSRLCGMEIPLAFPVQICYHNPCIKTDRKHDRCPIDLFHKSMRNAYAFLSR